VRNSSACSNSWMLEYAALANCNWRRLFQGRIKGADPGLLTAPCCPAKRLNCPPLMEAVAAPARRPMRPARCSATTPSKAPHRCGG